METRWRATMAMLAASMLLGGGSAGARTAGSGRAARAEAVFEEGVRQYSSGRFDLAQVAFQEALVLDPGHRVARVSLERIRIEHPFRELPAEAPRRSPRSSPQALAHDASDSPFASAERMFFFERTLGDARSDLGRLQSMLGRIAQLQAERRYARSRGRRFARRAELLELSRRLPSASC